MNRLWYSLARAVGEALTPAPPPKKGVRRVEGLLGKIGWPVRERVGESGLLLYFTDPVVNVRKVMVTCVDDAAAISAFSGATFAPHDVPELLGYYLLDRNRQAHFAAWQLAALGGRVGFAACYTVLLGGLAPPAFKVLAESVCGEAREADKVLRGKGLI